MNRDHDQDQQHDRREADRQGERAPEENPGPVEQQDQHPFLRQMRQVLRQGVPEPGAVNPGPAPRPVRSGDFHAGPVSSNEKGEER